MLFSRTDIAKYINENFEPAWEMVRPVPTVTIDFGNGKTIKRTLNGNVASYVCTTNGTIVDVLPGIYDPVTYIAKLAHIRYVASQLPDDLSDVPRFIKLYHQMPDAYHSGLVNDGLPAAALKPSPALSGDMLKNLLADTLDNEGRRREMIHNRLASSIAKPNELKRWLYKEVLHADLDDPYLGLDRQISGSYPFDDHQG